MPAIDPRRLGDRDLLSCVDEYFERTLRRIRERGNEKHVALTVHSEQYSPTAEFKITHQLQLAPYSEGAVNDRSGDMLLAVGRVLANHHVAQTVAPRERHLALEYVPFNEDKAIDAEFEECTQQGTDDDTPF